MANTITTTGTISASAQWNQSQTLNGAAGGALNLFPTTDNNSLGFGPQVANGNAAGQINKVYRNQLSIGASGSQTLVLGNSSMKDPYGNGLVFTAISCIIITLPKVITNQASSITVGGAGANPITDIFAGSGTAKFRVKQSNAGVLFGDDNTAYTVTAGAADQLLFTNEDGANTASINVVILGRG